MKTGGSEMRCNVVAVLVIGLLLLGMSALPKSIFAETQSAAKQRALDEVAALDVEIARMSSELWNFSEIALEERRSSEFLAGVLEAAGFKVRRGVAGMPTAFVAEWGAGRPIIGVLAEYDALPEIGNDPIPRRQVRSDGQPHGHGCGHNLFGAGSVGAAIALKRTMENEGLRGIVRLYGTPAEETLVGKVYMANAGLFDDLDAALDWHPDIRSGVMNQRGQAMNNFAVEFFGQSAHGAYDPWNGRSALDAAELMNHGVNLMREHIEPTARIHYVTTDGGNAPNVVPDYARVWYYARESNRKKVDENYAWILDVAAGAARATRTRHEVTLITGVHEMLLNRPLQEAAQRNLELVGVPAFGAEEQAFARELQEFMELESAGIDIELASLSDEVEPPDGGSTDVAEVSWITPTGSFYVVSAGVGLPWHSWATSASHGIPGAAKSAQVAARVLALTGVDLLTDPDLLERAKVDFREHTGGKPYVSPIPVDQKPPLPAREK
jgi:aminobenzoyl-glutamate utilization protein B